MDSPGLMDDSDEADHKAGNGKGAGKTKRNPKQQAQNKQAQQRSFAQSPAIEGLALNVCSL